MIAEIKGTRILKELLSNQSKRIICEQGGSRSSKTWSIFQYFFIKSAQGEKFTLTIVRDKLTWVKQTLLKDFQELTALYNLPVFPEININRPEQIYKLFNSEFAFFGLDYSEKLHGRKQDYTWLNEALEIAKKHFDQLEMRTTKQLILDYNPYNDEHWVFDLQKRDDVVFLRSTMLDNPFLPESILNKIKSYEPTEFNINQGTADEYMWQVYGLGNKAKLKGTIFNNWQIVDKIPETARFIAYGLDFGYSNDPSALTETYLQDNDIYVNELIYKTGMTNDDLAGEMKLLAIKPVEEIWCDSSEPKSIEEIRRSGFNTKSVIKGQDSINFGIDLLKSYKVFYTARSVNLEAEMRKYKWREDRTGKMLNEPVDEYNHALDSLRYVVMSRLKKTPQIKIISKNIGF